MKAELQSYMHAVNGLSLQLMPETETEAQLLKAIWAHGHLNTGHPCGAKWGTGYYISAFDKQAGTAAQEPTP